MRAAAGLVVECFRYMLTIHRPHDALDLLYKAATDDNRGGRDGSVQLSPMMGNASQGQRPISSHMQSMNQHIRNDMQPPRPRDPTIDPSLASNGPPAGREQGPGYQDAIKAWSRFRFVRAGWFTAAEAIDYIY